MTTLHSTDLPILHKALGAANKSLGHAYLDHSMERLTEIVDVLAPNSTSLTILETLQYVSKMQWPYESTVMNNLNDLCEFIDTRAGDLTLQDKAYLMKAPIPWRDQSGKEIVTKMHFQYRTAMRVDLINNLKGNTFNYLEEVELSMKHAEPHSSGPALMALETLHKILVFYAWMQMRLPVSWSDDVSDLKKRVEAALDWSLQGESWGQRREKAPDIKTLRQRGEDAQIQFRHKEEIKRQRRETHKRRSEEQALLKAGVGE